MTIPAETKQTANQLGLLDSELDLIISKLGRIPNFNELCIFSVMWSEHCSYKNSIKWLKTLPREGKNMLVKAGEENAGVVNIGDNIGCVFKIESHNHPSAIEPYQGAATGVGGIHRDIFTMGARPICALNSLRFGSFELDKTKWLMNGVVKGIGDYGNCFGVPTVTGETFFDKSYNGNPLVNAMSVGIVDKDAIISATAKGIGNPVFIVGSDTGKDGIGGASFASKDISEDSAADLPAVQVGDPFQEKLLLEATLELAQTGVIVGMQDMGAAGITCSTSEMSEKGGVGMDIFLDKVPTRQNDMKPFEILLSESQERMLVVVEKGKEQVALDIFDKWDLNCVQIGHVTEGGLLRYFWHGEIIAEIPAWELVLGGGAPVYEREFKTPKEFEERASFDLNNIEIDTNFVSNAKQMLQLPNIASKKWLYRQYDSMVGVNNTNTNNPSDAAVVRVFDTKKGVVTSVDCNSRYVAANPFVGTMIAVSEAARNIVCSGGEPLAVTNCLNFGNPNLPEVYWYFVEAIKGMGEACRKFETPVTGGNVSFYNQNEEGPVFPTPTIGMVGRIADIHNKMTLGFKAEGDAIYIIGKQVSDLASSEYLANLKNVEKMPAPYFNLEEEFQMQQTVISLIQSNVLESCHDLADGGLWSALCESSFVNQFGFEIASNKEIRKDAFLFGEAQGRVLVSTKDEKSLQAICNQMQVPFEKIGMVKADAAIIDQENYGRIQDLKALYDDAIESKM